MRASSTAAEAQLVSLFGDVTRRRRRRCRSHKPQTNSTSADDALTQNVHVGEPTKTIHFVDE
jgi:hypothetical protein